MKGLNIVFALAALGTGLTAALKWYNASKVEIDLGYYIPARSPEKHIGGWDSISLGCQNRAIQS